MKSTAGAAPTGAIAAGAGDPSTNASASADSEAVAKVERRKNTVLYLKRIGRAY
jgi:hypothetical protein